MANAQMIHDAQEFLASEAVPGWLIYDYLGCNPVLAQIAPSSGHVTRPVFLYVPASGSPTLLTHHVDAGKFAEAGVDTIVYSSRATLETALRDTLTGAASVAMEYSPRNGLPRVSRVDAGTVELVRSMGPDVISSADLMQYATQRWSPEQLASHRRAADALGRIVNEAFARIGQRLADGVTEFEVAEFIRQRFKEEGLTTADGPI
ncbi:MAG: aminopeptidase P family protein, partial [Chloroflexi bacterium]|nr:aminopeptidase P family protein [Chloroflexota bacterium]